MTSNSRINLALFSSILHFVHQVVINLKIISKNIENESLQQSLINAGKSFN